MVDHSEDEIMSAKMLRNLLMMKIEIALELKDGKNWGGRVEWKVLLVKALNW